MFKLLKSRKGFTLFEIIIVIIIVGVLAAIILPQFSAAVDKSKAAEAMSVFNQMGKAVQNCFQEVNSVVTNCDTAGELGMTLPSVAAGSNFTYVFANGGGNAVSLYAAYNASGAVGADVITFTYFTSGQIAKNCQTGGKFANFCR